MTRKPSEFQKKDRNQGGEGYKIPIVLFAQSASELRLCVRNPLPLVNIGGLLSPAATSSLHCEGEATARSLPHWETHLRQRLRASPTESGRAGMTSASADDAILQHFNTLSLSPSPMKMRNDTELTQWLKQDASVRM